MRAPAPPSSVAIGATGAVAADHSAPERAVAGREAVSSSGAGLKRDLEAAGLPEWGRIALRRAKLETRKGSRSRASGAGRDALFRALSVGVKRAISERDARGEEPKRARVAAAPAHHATNAERRDAIAERKARALMAKMPLELVHQVAGPQVGAAEADELMRSMIVAQGGPEGAKTGKMQRALELLLEAARRRDLPNWGLPAGPGLIAAIVSAELAAAIKAKAGATVGKDRQEGFIGLAECGLAIAADHPLVNAATIPPAWLAAELSLRPLTQAPGLPITAQLQFETVANAAEWSPMRSFARSIVMVCLLMHVRLNDALNAKMHTDERHPSRVVRARTVLKQKKRKGPPPPPIELYAPAEGWLGRIEYVAEHLEEMSDRKHAIPDFKASRGRVSRATALLPGVCPAAKCRQAFADVLAQPPLCLTAEQWASWCVTTHSPHTSAGDMTRYMMARHITASAGGLLPELMASEDFVPRPFTYEDSRALGHWLFDKNAPKDEARPGKGAAPKDFRPGAAAARGQMNMRYSSGSGRRGERHEQLEVRARNVNAVRAALARFGRPWWELPRGTADWDIL